MRRTFALASAVFTAALAWGGLNPPAEAEITAAPPCPTPRTVWLPGGYQLVTRQVPVNARVAEHYVPIYQTWEEPVIECVQVPNMVARQVPYYELRQAPVSEVRKVAVWADVTVPVYAYRSKPVLGPSWTCANEEKLIPWWSINEKVQCGVTTERRMLGYREVRVQSSTVGVRVLAGHRTEMVACGTKPETRILGTRTVRRCVGWRTEAVVAAPAGTKAVCERVERPGQWVTLSDAPVRPAPLPGTALTLTTAEYRTRYAEAQKTR